MARCNGFHKKPRLRCQGEKGHSTPHEAYDPKTRKVVTWESVTTVPSKRKIPDELDED